MHCLISSPTSSAKPAACAVPMCGRISIGTRSPCASWVPSPSDASNKSRQGKADEPAFPFTKSIFRWDYSCPAGLGCTFACPGQAGSLGHLIKLRLYLGAISIDGSQTAPALFYEYSTREFPQASGFSIGSGLSNLSCHVNGMTLDYSGPSK